MTKRMRDKEYRSAWLRAFVRRRIASQIRSLRGELKQGEFGAKIQKPQTVVCRLENPARQVPSVSTLLEIAEALDLALIVEFVSFGEAIERAKESTPESLTPSSFDVEQKALCAAAEYIETKASVTSESLGAIGSTETGRMKQWLTA